MFLLLSFSYYLSRHPPADILTGILAEITSCIQSCRKHNLLMGELGAVFLGLVMTGTRNLEG